MKTVISASLNGRVVYKRILIREEYGSLEGYTLAVENSTKALGRGGYVVASSVEFERGL